MEIGTHGTQPCFACGKNPRLLIIDLYDDGLERPHAVCAECHAPPISDILYYELDPTAIWAVLKDGQTVVVPCHRCDPYWRPFKGEVTKKEPLHRILREVLRGFTVFEEYCTSTGEYEITWKGIKFNFLDLQQCLDELTPRLAEAVYWFVIKDEEAKDVGKRLGISNVTVSGHVDQAMNQIITRLWPDYEGD